MFKKVAIKYELGHTAESTYKKIELYCPSCGQQEVWQEQGSGDFYEGVDYACVNCKAHFTLPSLGTNEGSYEGEQLINQLKEMGK